MRKPDQHLTARVERGLARVLPDAPGGAPERLARLAELVTDWGTRINLSGHRAPADLVDRLVLDAAGIGSVLPGFATLVDLGSGAGFPGLPLAILFPDAAFTLVEARQRRHHFQRAAVRELGLANVEPVQGRIEHEPTTHGDIALAQAVGPAADVFRAIRPWARAGGLLAIPALLDARAPELGPELGVLEAREYRLPMPDDDEVAETRVLWLVRAP